MANDIPEPTNGSRIVVETGNDADPLRLYWRDDAEAARRTIHPNERRWFDNMNVNMNADPLIWGLVCYGAERVFLTAGEAWGSLVQPEDEARVAVRLIVEQVVRDVEYDRDEYEQAKADESLDHLIDTDVSNMDGDSVVVEADGTQIKPF